jgi:Muconolactone delta-isomerase
MLYLVTSTNTRDVSPLLAAESERVNELRAAGVIRNGWVKADLSGAFLLLDCANEAEASAVLNTLPAVINDATTFVLTEVVGLGSPG